MVRVVALLLLMAGVVAGSVAQERAAEMPFRIGIIGLDTSHAPAFAKEFNDPKAAEELRGFRVVAAYPKGSADIPSSVQRVPEYAAAVK